MPLVLACQAKSKEIKATWKVNQEITLHLDSLHRDRSWHREIRHSVALGVAHFSRSGKCWFVASAVSSARAEREGCCVSS